MTKLLIGDAGHGCKDPGTSGAGLQEAKLTEEADAYIAARFAALGVPYKRTRPNKDCLTNDQRTRRVKSSGATLCYSYHFNSGKPSQDRVEVIHSVHAGSDVRRHAQNLANAIAKVSGQDTKVYSRKLSSTSNNDYYFMHRQTGNVRTLIVEFQFLDGPGVKKLHDKKYREAMYEALVKEHCAYIGHKYVALGAAAKPTSPAPKPAGRTFQPAGKSHAEAWEWAYKEGLLDGHAPNEPLTRAQFATVMKRISDKK